MSSRTFTTRLQSLQNHFVSLEGGKKGRCTLGLIDKKGFVAFDAAALTAVNTWIAAGSR